MPHPGTHRPPALPLFDAPEAAAQAAPALSGMEHEHAKADALRTMRAIQSNPTLADRLLDLYRRAASGEWIAPDGIAHRGVTDYEAADALGVERSTINPTRAEVAKGAPIESLDKRYCTHRPSSVRVNAWGLARPDSDPRSSAMFPIHP